MSLFSDPRSWTGSMVKTWTRFWLIGALLALNVLLLVYAAAEDGIRSGLAASVFMISLQFYFLYALRRLYFDGAHKAGMTNGD